MILLSDAPNAPDDAPPELCSYPLLLRSDAPDTKRFPFLVTIEIDNGDTPE
jgi:hypothetical protein